MRAIARLCICAVTIATLAGAGQAGGIPGKTVKELKAATVYIKVQFRDGMGPFSATGSGFLLRVDGETGFVVTNHHVVNSNAVGTVREGNPQLVFHSGTPNEKTVEGAIVASDPTRDLAVLKVTGFKDLPRPIPMDVDNEATETMTVYSLGFPFGDKLIVNKAEHPAINITRGTVTSLRMDNRGDVFLVQIDAEINHGNSGGPIVDEKGKLLGIAVSKIVEARTVSFAIPIKPLAEMMQGKINGMHFDTTQVEKGKAQISVQATVLDPLRKLGTVTIHYRTLKAKKDFEDLPRPDKDGTYPVLKDAKQASVKVLNGKAAGTFSMERGEGEGGADSMAVFFQASYVNGAGKTITGPAGIITLTFPKVIIADKLTRSDPIDKDRMQPSKRYTHKVQAGKHYVIEMRGDPKEIDPWLILRDSAGNILAQDDDSGGYPNALIVYSPRKDDECQITATVFKGELLGPFSLRIREETGVEVGRKGFTKTGVLSATDPLDALNLPARTFNLILKKGIPCIVELKSKDFDPYVRLENMAGVNLKFEDKVDKGLSSLVYTPYADSIYRVVATSYNGKTGAFELKVKEGAPPKQYEVGEAGLKLPASLTNTDAFDVEFGKLTNYRCKIFELKLKAGQKIQLDVATNQFNAVLRIEDDRGKELAFDQKQAGNPRLIFAPPAAGVFRVIISHGDNRMGNFELIVRQLAAEKGA